jgi:hypothetical protein
MATTSRQTAIFGVEDWKRIYQTYREADFQSYDFETLRKSFVDYLRLYYPETFNDYIESQNLLPCWMSWPLWVKSGISHRSKHKRKLFRHRRA